MTTSTNIARCAVCDSLPATLEQLVGWRHAHGAPCWYLLREVYRQHLGIDLPLDNVLEPKDQWHELVDAERGRWRRVSVPTRYAAVLVRPPAHMTHVYDHVGVALGRDGSMVHYPHELAGVCIGGVQRYHDAGWSVGIYRYLGVS